MHTYLTNKTLLGLCFGIGALGVQALALGTILDEAMTLASQREYLASIVAKNPALLNDADRVALRDLGVAIKSVN